MADEPILVDLAELGFKGLPRVCIFAGKTEDEMTTQLLRVGIKLSPRFDAECEEFGCHEATGGAGE